MLAVRAPALGSVSPRSQRRALLDPTLPLSNLPPHPCDRIRSATPNRWGSRGSSRIPVAVSRVDPQVIRTYIDHFLPREVVGPVLIVFSLEGVIDGIFNLYVPQGSATIGWTIVFVLSIVVVAYWGTNDEEALEELAERVEEMEESHLEAREG